MRRRAVNVRRFAFRAGLCFLLLVTLRYAWPSAAAPAHTPALAELRQGVFVPDRTIPIYSVETDEPVVALGFNAAWEDTDIPEILAALDEAGVRASFFVLGEWAMRYPESTCTIARSHEVMSHGMTHADMTGMDTAALTASLDEADAVIGALTGSAVDLVRPPSGAWDDAVARAIYASGRYPIQWSVDSLDWKGLSADKITARVLEGLAPGAIVLLHVGAPYTAEALPALLAGIAEAGYRCVPVGELILRGEFTLDRTGRQYPA